MWNLLEASADPCSWEQVRAGVGREVPANLTSASGPASSASGEEWPLPSFAFQITHEGFISRASHWDPVQKGNLGAPFLGETVEEGGGMPR